MNKRSADVRLFLSNLKKETEEKATRTGLCVFCERREPTEKGYRYSVPVYCGPCHRLLDFL